MNNEEMIFSLVNFIIKTHKQDSSWACRCGWTGSDHTTHLMETVQSSKFTVGKKTETAEVKSEIEGLIKLVQTNLYNTLINTFVDAAKKMDEILDSKPMTDVSRRMKETERDSMKVVADFLTRQRDDT